MKRWSVTILVSIWTWKACSKQYYNIITISSNWQRHCSIVPTQLDKNYGLLTHFVHLMRECLSLFQNRFISVLHFFLHCILFLYFVICVRSTLIWILTSTIRLHQLWIFPNYLLSVFMFKWLIFHKCNWNYRIDMKYILNDRRNVTVLSLGY